MIDWTQTPKETIERGEEWIRGEDIESTTPIHTHPPRTWRYYLAWGIMFALLITFLTGTGFVILHKGQNVIQRYIEKIGYGLDNPDGK
jgi:hypothetical protein